MAGLSQKDQKRLLDHVEAQGVSITETGKGYLFRFLDGGTAMLHKTQSDRMAPMALRAKLRRHGVSWPFDGVEAKLPSYIVDAGPLRKGTLDRYRGVIEVDGKLPDTIYPSDVLRNEHQARHPGEDLPKNQGFTQAYRAMYQLGYLPGGKQVRGKGRPWILPAVIEDNEPVKPVTPVAPETFWKPGEAPHKTRPDDEQIIDIPKEEPVADAAEREVVQLHGQSAGREFIDSVESWTMDAGMVPPATSVEDLTAMLRSLGLGWELRVWRQ